MGGKQSFEGPGARTASVEHFYNSCLSVFPCCPRRTVLPTYTSLPPTPPSHSKGRVVFALSDFSPRFPSRTDCCPALAPPCIVVCNWVSSCGALGFRACFTRCDDDTIASWAPCFGAWNSAQTQLLCVCWEFITPAWKGMKARRQVMSLHSSCRLLRSQMFLFFSLVFFFISFLKKIYFKQPQYPAAREATEACSV